MSTVISYATGGGGSGDVSKTYVDEQISIVNTKIDTKVNQIEFDDALNPELASITKVEPDVEETVET